jgi:hypothetical protein
MFTRRFVLLTVVLVSLIAFSGLASAVTTADIVDADGSSAAQPGTPATYSWNQSPWLHFESPSSLFTYTVSWWNFTGDSLKTPSLEITSGTTSVWSGFSNFADWSAIRKAGNWTVRADYSTAGGAGTTGEIAFKVNAVPEPISSALFLLGGATLAVRQYRKKGKKS